jgi:hopene-associated glycosyltransferase HpnB
MTTAAWLGGLSLIAWIYLLLGRGGFWLARERDDNDAATAPEASWPAVVAVVPARDEADVVAHAVTSLVQQDYPGPFRVILVDDQSSDGTSATARAAARDAGAADKLQIVPGQLPPNGWTGKLWAVHQGIEQARSDAPEYLLLTDADIAHAPDNLRRLVQRAREGGCSLVSQMVKLRCETWAEKAFIPAFVFFFQMLFPFAWVNRPHTATAAAAGGCMLVRRQALEAIGGIGSIRHEIIDDCALGHHLKIHGPIRLTLTENAVSLRPYENVGEIRRMVARSAYAQLHYSPVLLLGTVIAMAIIFLAPPILALFGTGDIRLAGATGWLAMALALQPMLRFYRLSPLWGLAFPAIAAAYTAFTIDSALQHWRGRGGMWKGRAQAIE